MSVIIGKKALGRKLQNFTQWYKTQQINVYFVSG
jgi:hypothetical protein